MTDDSYYEQPAPDPLELASLDADNLVAEWAAHEFEVWIGVYPSASGGDPVFILNRVAQDGLELFTGSMLFDDVYEMRAHLTREFPWPPPAG